MKLVVSLREGAQGHVASLRRHARRLAVSRWRSVAVVATTTAARRPRTGRPPSGTAEAGAQGGAPRPAARAEATLSSYTVVLRTSARSSTSGWPRGPRPTRRRSSLAGVPVLDDTSARAFVQAGGEPHWRARQAGSRAAAYDPGVVAMAKAGNEPAGTAGSQFFSCPARASGLTPDYALLGKVTERDEGGVLLTSWVPRAGAALLQSVAIEKVTVRERGLQAEHRGLRRGLRASSARASYLLWLGLRPAVRPVQAAHAGGLPPRGLPMVDVDANRGLLRRHSASRPAVKAFRDGRVAAGVTRRCSAERFFDALVPSEADELARSGEEGGLLSSGPARAGSCASWRGDTGEAVELLEGAP